MPGQVHMVPSVPPRRSVFSELGYLKGVSHHDPSWDGESEARVHRQAFLGKGVFSGTVGLGEEMIREYVRHQEEAGDQGQPGLFPTNSPLSGAFLQAAPIGRSL